MFGPDGTESPRDPTLYGSSDGDSRGLVYRACAEIIQEVSQRTKIGIRTSIGVSYVEVFGDTVSDLLRSGARCGHSKVAAQRFVLTGAAQVEASSLSEIMHLLRIGEDQKRRAATMMNERSSRAHSILILSLTQLNLETGVERTSKMFLADLGGSEQVKKSQVSTFHS
jgi:kinesin family protein 5